MSSSDATDPKTRPERTQTDQSLGAERKKTDRELAESRARVEEDADEVVEKARERADEVVRVARQRADEGSAGRETVSQIVNLERVRGAEDDEVREERAAADLELLKTGAARQRALAALLEVEREHTDVNLSSERHRSDDAVDARDHFLAMVTHDLRSLLGGVALEAAMIAKDGGAGPAGDTLRRRSTNVRRYVTRMSRLVGDLVDVASIESGKLNVLVETRDAAQIFAEAVDVFEPLASARSLTLTGECPSPSLPATFDHDRVLQVLANLLGNAIKFTEPGGRIGLRLEAKGPFAQFAVSDTGPGIAADQLEAVFERFRQLKRYDARGLGLGLFIARCIVEAHGGRIWCESKEGVGSTFFFTLPLATRGPA